MSLLALALDQLHLERDEVAPDLPIQLVLVLKSVERLEEFRLILNLKHLLDTELVLRLLSSGAHDCELEFIAKVCEKADAASVGLVLLQARHNEKFLFLQL